MVNRLLLIFSLLLVVFTFLFSQFMNAQLFYEGKARDLEVQLKMIEKDPHKTEEINFLKEKIDYFNKFHKQQENYTRISAGLMGLLLLLTAICFPLGSWKNSSFIIKAITFLLTLELTTLGVLGFLYALGIWNP